MQLWYAMGDLAMADARYEIESMRVFAGLELGEDALLYKMTILEFRRLPQDHDLVPNLLAAVSRHLKTNGLMLREGTMAHATITFAPNSTKNCDRNRGPKMHQTRKS